MDQNEHWNSKFSLEHWVSNLVAIKITWTIKSESFGDLIWELVAFKSTPDGFDTDVWEPMIYIIYCWDFN